MRSVEPSSPAGAPRALTKSSQGHDWFQSGGVADPSYAVGELTFWIRNTACLGRVSKFNAMRCRGTMLRAAAVLPGVSSSIQYRLFPPKGPYQWPRTSVNALSATPVRPAGTTAPAYLKNCSHHWIDTNVNMSVNRTVLPAPSIGTPCEAVEGLGDAKAVPGLVRNILWACHSFDIPVARAIRTGGKSSLLNKFEQHLRYAVVEGCTAILVLLDADEECPREKASDLARKATELNPAIRGLEVQVGLGESLLCGRSPGEGPRCQPRSSACVAGFDIRP